MKELTPEERAAWRERIEASERRLDELKRRREAAIAQMEREYERRRDATRLFGFIWTR
jgi:hypothetical protein